MHTTPSKNFIELDKVDFQVTHGSQKKALLTNINLKIVDNDMISIIGPNGAGKSTLVKLILGLLKPTAGKIIKRENLIIGYVPQKFSVPSSLPLRVIDLFKQARADRLSNQEKQQLFKALSLQPLLSRQIIQLSGGETQRVLLARALLEKPELLILDEPMQGLDPETEDLLYLFIDNLPNFLDCAMLVISHDLHWVMKGSRHVVCLDKHICCEGSPTVIKDQKEFQHLFGSAYNILLNEHKFQQPYLHKHPNCNHTDCNHS